MEAGEEAGETHRPQERRKGLVFLKGAARSHGRAPGSLQSGKSLGRTESLRLFLWIRRGDGKTAMEARWLPDGQTDRHRHSEYFLGSGRKSRSSLQPRHDWHINLCRGAVLCPVGCWSASLACPHYVSVASTPNPDVRTKNVFRCYNRSSGRCKIHPWWRMIEVDWSDDKIVSGPQTSSSSSSSIREHVTNADYQAPPMHWVSNG